ncbi:glycosyltransferase [Fonticella tunisiensis]|uniref:Glycosyltransferase involved in cell wall biosynthesis n=1 Tax=Fonticella tunisiensis TaxID=1096341 RepID=A0A4V3ERG9_9CLOT|nr:glycosyltransferase [Fonticella tunisiensis]TDT46083.1 glycosyltransferase involved in cell wall biosynthesis [Fonticella tunisiensis]
MKIVNINTRFKGGGGASAIANLLHSFINNNTEHESVFLYARGDKGDQKSIVINNQFDVYFSAAFARIFGVSKNLNFSSVIEEQIARADIVHIHNIHGYYINYEKLIKIIKYYKKPVIWTLHDVWPITGRCAFTYDCGKWVTGCYNCSYKNTYPKTLLDRSSKEWNRKKELFCSLDKDKVIFVSPSRWLEGFVKKSFLKEYFTEVIPNGIYSSSCVNVDKNDIREELNLPINKKIVLFVAADPNDKRKGISYVLNLLDKLGEDVAFVSVGKKIKKIKKDNFIQLGYIKDKACLNKIYRAADIFLITSLDDNFPTTVLEAFSNALPVIGFKVGGIEEQLSNNCGILVEKENVYQLEREIRSLILDEVKLSELGKNGFNKFNQEYTIDVFATRYLKLYEKLYRGE